MTGSWHGDCSVWIWGSCCSNMGSCKDRMSWEDYFGFCVLHFSTALSFLLPFCFFAQAMAILSCLAELYSAFWNSFSSKYFWNRNASGVPWDSWRCQMWFKNSRMESFVRFCRSFHLNPLGTYIPSINIFGLSESALKATWFCFCPDASSLCERRSVNVVWRWKIEYTYNNVHSDMSVTIFTTPPLFGSLLLRLGATKDILPSSKLSDPDTAFCFV